jgi:hypothetical protein
MSYSNDVTYRLLSLRGWAEFPAHFGGTMSSNVPVEAADRLSRRRAILVAVAVIAFLGAQTVARPYFVGGPDSDHDAKALMWGVHVGLLLLVLATGGCLLRTKGVRALMNDEVTKAHQRASVIAGYWVAMATALGLYVVPGAERLAAREAVYIVVTASIAAALLVFSYLEYRALRDA